MAAFGDDGALFVGDVDQSAMCETAGDGILWIQFDEEAALKPSMPGNVRIAGHG